MVEQNEGMSLKSYADYETYRAVQIAANKKKINRQMIRQPQIQRIAQAINTVIDDVQFGICHGTRRGGEQANFMRFLNRKSSQKQAEVWGTEISDTATQFPNTIEWDFHEEYPDWVGRADFVYSNSWDHAFDPEKMFKTWFRSLRPGGVMVIHYGPGYLPSTTSQMDPFGADKETLIERLPQWASVPVRYLRSIDVDDAERFNFNCLMFQRDEA